MARRPRITLAGVPQHVVLRGNNRQRIFFGDADFRFLYDTLRDVASVHGCAVHAYVFMTNHLHLLVTPWSPDALPFTMRDVGRCYVQQHVNRLYGRSGTLWEGRYKSALVQAQRYFLACMRYIEMNPIRAGLAHRPEDYLWSSSRHYLHGDPDPLVTPHEEYLALGATEDARRRAYRCLFSFEDALDVAKIRDATRSGVPLGEEEFVEAVAGHLRRPVGPGRRGRRALRSEA